MLLFSQTRHLGTPSIETESLLVKLEFSNVESFCRWLRTENEIVEWNLTRLRSATNSDQKLPEGTNEMVTKKGRPRTVEWTKNFTCSFGGTPRARSGESSQRTITKPSRKVGCMAKIKAQKKFSCDTIYVTFLNQHSGHSLNTLKTWTWSRMSSATRR